ncbi:hypothetical protein [Legionella sainthelensi]|uniref:hypothetical protein n=1 Tax=Legionella sainthelensi TaxID=28087 RepID=UPI000E20C0FB|nr:hypothetical protein [Legionella sainthelensi]
MINADNYFAVRWASEYGYRDILEYLVGLEMYVEPNLPVWARDAEAFMIDLTPDESNRPQQYSGNMSILEFFTSISRTETEQEFLVLTPKQSIH